MSMRIDLGFEFLCFHHNNKCKCTVGREGGSEWQKTALGREEGSEWQKTALGREGGSEWQKTAECAVAVTLPVEAARRVRFTD